MSTALAPPGHDEPAPSPAPGREARAGALFALIALAATFTAAAVVRRLNFDECLALAAGYRLVSGTPAAPPFAMPITALLGALGHTLADPAAVFLIARLAVVASVAATAWWSARAAALPAVEAFLAGCLTLANAAFAVHGLEFRYDWAILLALLLAYGLLVRGSERDFTLLGLVIAWTAVHHVKGLYFAAVLYAFAVWRSARGRRRLLRLHAALLAALAVWAAAAALLGFGHAAADLLPFWLEAGRGTEGRDFRALGETFRRDGVFWVAASLSAAWLLIQVERPRLSNARESRTLWATALALAALAFPLLHPQPWPYMLALPAPFAALVIARGVLALATRSLIALSVAVLCAALQPAFSGTTVLTAYIESFASPRAPEERTLAMLARLRGSGERVLDPSGLAYFAPPCSTEWYVDGLLERRVASGRWMRELESLDPAGCPWLVKTHRLGMLPGGAARTASEAYVVVPGGLGLAREDARLPELTRMARVGPHDMAGRFLVKSFW